MFHKYNPFTNTLSPSDQISAYTPQSFGTKEATNNFFVVPQPKGRYAGGSGAHSKGSSAGGQSSIFRFFSNKLDANTSALTAKVQAVASTVSQATGINSSQGAGHATHSGGHGHAVHSDGHADVHGHDSHAAPWESVNLWRTPYKGDTDTITQVKRNKGTLDQFVENRTRRIQQLQLHALRNKTRPTWIMMPRDKVLFAVQGIIVAYVLYQVTTSVYKHLKAKDRLKLIKLLYKDNVN